MRARQPDRVAVPRVGVRTRGTRTIAPGLTDVQSAVGNRATVALVARARRLHRMALEDVPGVWSSEKAGVTSKFAANSWSSGAQKALLDPISWPPVGMTAKALFKALTRIATAYTGAQFLVTKEYYSVDDLLSKGAPDLATARDYAQYRKQCAAASALIEAGWKSLTSRAGKHADGSRLDWQNAENSPQPYGNGERKLTDAGGNWVEWKPGSPPDARRRYFTQAGTDRIWYTNNGTHDAEGSPWFKRYADGDWRQAHVGWVV